MPRVRLRQRLPQKAAKNAAWAKNASSQWQLVSEASKVRLTSIIASSAKNAST